MASPTSVSRTPTAVTTASNSWTVNLDPNIASGDLLIVVMRVAEAETSTWPSGYQNYLNDGTNTWHDLDLDASDDTITVIARDCDGSEPSTINVTFGSTAKGAVIAYRISGARPYSSQSPDILSAIGSSLNPDCPSENVTGGPKDILALALDTHAGEQTTTVTYPTSYTNTGQITSGSGGATATNCQINYCDRQISAASSENPSQYTISGSQPWTAITILVQQPAGDTITGVALTTTPSLPVGRIESPVMGVVLTITPSLPAGKVNSSLTGVALAVTPSLPAGKVNSALTGIVLTVAPSLPAGRIDATVVGVVLTTTPSLPAGRVDSALTGIVLTTVPTLPAGRIDSTVVGIVLTITPTLPVGEITTPSGDTVTGVALAITPNLPAGRIDSTVIGIVLTTTPSLPVGRVDNALTGVVLTTTPTLPVGSIASALLGVALSATPTMPAGQINVTLAGIVLSIVPTMPVGSVSAVVNVTIDGVVLTIVPVLPVGVIRRIRQSIKLTRFRRGGPYELGYWDREE